MTTKTKPRPQPKPQSQLPPRAYELARENMNMDNHSTYGSREN